MKFRAVMIDAGPMREFTNIVSTMSKLCRECVLRISETHLYCIVSEQGGPAPPLLWCELPQRSFFSEFQMVGLDDEHRDIYLSLISANLAKSLSTLKSAKSVKLKLTKKQCPCLTLEIELQSAATMQTRHVTHDIPVSVVPRKLWTEFKEPDTPAPHISIELPPLRQVRAVVERMRALAGEVCARAAPDGRLTLELHTVLAKVATRFSDLAVHHYSGPPQTEDSDDEDTRPTDSCHCRIDAKKLSMFLSAEITHRTAVCSIVHKKLVILTLESDDRVKLQCFIGGIYY